jgi:hypothetical protein
LPKAAIAGQNGGSMLRFGLAGLTRHSAKDFLSKTSDLAEGG